MPKNKIALWQMGILLSKDLEYQDTILQNVENIIKRYHYSWRKIYKNQWVVLEIVYHFVY